MASKNRIHPRTGEEESFNKLRTPPRPIHGRSNKGLAPEDYDVGWICALPAELAVVTAMLEYIHKPLARKPGDTNSYTLGSIGTHNIVIACLPKAYYIETVLDGAVTDMSRSFPSIKKWLMVGIGGGAPTRETDVKPGDVVVGEEVIRYEMGKTLPKGEFSRIGSRTRPPQAASFAIAELRASHTRTQSQVPNILFKMTQHSPEMATRYPEFVKDQLPLHDLTRRLRATKSFHSTRPLRISPQYYQIYNLYQDQDRFTPEDLRQSLLSSLMGLAERSYFKTSREVHLIYESVWDYHIKENGIRDLWPDCRQDFAASIHHRFKESGYQYKRVNIEPLIPLALEIHFESKKQKDMQAKILNSFPQLKNDNSQLFCHAEAAGPIIPEHEFVQFLRIGSWLKFRNSFVKNDNRCHSQDTSQMDFLWLLWIGIELGLDVPDSLIFAVVNGPKEVVKILVDIIGGDLEACRSCRDIALCLATAKWHGAVMKLLIDKVAHVESQNKIGHRALRLASQGGDETLVRLLLRAGVDIKGCSEVDEITLPWALRLRKRCETLLKVSLENEAKFAAVHRHGYTDPPTDSGYASSSKGNKSGDPATDPSFQESTNEFIDDTNATIYPDASSTTFSRWEYYVSELAGLLASEIRSLCLSRETQSRVSEALPEMLRAFALKIGHGASDKMHRDVMAFVHKRRHEIAAAFADTGFDRQTIIKKEMPDLDDVYRKERVSDWVNSENFEQTMPEEDYSNSVNCQHMPKSTKQIEESDESAEDEDVTEPWIQDYCEFIITTPAFKWLLARLRNEIRLVPMEPYGMEMIGKEIMSALPSSRVISKRMSSQSYGATFEVDWDIFEFFEKQGYSTPPHEAFRGIVTLTGSSLDAQAATCAQYLGQTWPSTAEDIIALMEGVLKDNQSDPPPRTLSDGTTLRVYVRNSKLLAESYGVAATIAEIGEQLAWLGAAMKTPPEQSGVFYCTPTISMLQKDLHWSQSQAKPRSPGISCKITIDVEKIPVTPATNGQCWQAVFKAPVIVRGYPIPQRGEWNTGLEIPLDIMAMLAQALELQEFNDKICLKGFSTMLVPVRRSGDIVFWHLLYKRDGSRISYLDNDLDQDQEVGRLDLLENKRHVLGWCSRAKLVIGETPSTPINCKCCSSVKHSRLGKPKPGGALTGKTVKRRRTVTIGPAVSIGARESPDWLSNGYVERLQFLKTRSVLLWDKDGERGWIVSGTVALLFALQAFLQGPYKTAVMFKSEDFQNSGGPLTAMSAFETLNNHHNKELLLYSDGTKLKSKIEDLCSLLEHLIEHQTDIAGPCGIKLSNKPRGHLEGWEFEDVAGMDQDPLHPRVAEIEPHGKGWVDFTRAIQAVTLFGRDFGDIIQPDVETCSRWASLPTGRYYIAVCVSDLDRVFKEHGFLSDGHIRLSDNLIWHTPSELVFCQCQYGSKQRNCEPVQAVFPLSLSLSESLNPRGDELPNDGALIFGHSSQFSWIWDDLHLPRKGQLGDPASKLPALKSPSDSGIGSSQTSSESECHVSSFSNLGIGSMELPTTGACNNSMPPNVSKLAYQTYPKHAYTVGILCALPKELMAVRALFDENYDPPENVPDDDRYVFGKVEHHMVVATSLSNCGTNEAACAATTMKHAFNLRFCLLVGIGGGVPSRDNDIRLGDVVVGEEVVQYDLGKRKRGGFEMKQKTLRCPPDFLMNAISTQLKANPSPQSDRLRCYLDTISKVSKLFCHQGEDQDVLFQSCFECPPSGEQCPQQHQHMPSQRDPRPTLEPKVHYGRIASGNQVIKDAGFRDEQAEKLNAICFEMEAAGVVNALPCLVIRGISDYCDDQKNDVWQEYAAATAAAYAKLLLHVVKKRDMDNDPRRH
ncbi:unnamed protein product [Clonostachys byssicola]|uniref:Nucleoside phosphorylase domain-containing protein n=1 Tax=Clonostachys byssicola TaxID=160290 RepID=A0A9N9XXG6_9HYPO|nr:unnamed protein product [Clonostachys byssicola]